MREPAPPYEGEGPFALWHVSEDPAIEAFRPHRSATAVESEPLVWALDTRHLPLYWFPRDCPRCTFWAHAGTTGDDVRRFLGGSRSRRVHVIETGWRERVAEAELTLYRLPEDEFEPHPTAGGYWISRATVAPLEVLTLRDLPATHAAAGIELRAVEALLPLWDEVVASTLEFSGMRLANAGA